LDRLIAIHCNFVSADLKKSLRLYQYPKSIISAIFDENQEMEEWEYYQD